MQNPKTWSGPTSWQHSGKVDKSGPNKNLSAHGRPTEVKATSMDHWKPTPTSGSGRPELGQGSTSMGMPHPVSSDRSEMKPSFAMQGPTDKSEPMPPGQHKSWKNKNYTMDTPGTMEAGAKIAKKMKAH